jgi:transcriptional regulator with XRE-family HTH domain
MPIPRDQRLRLAEDCNIDPRRIRRYEVGDASPSAPALETLAGVLGFPQSAFLDGDCGSDSHGANWRGLILRVAPRSRAPAQQLW